MPVKEMNELINKVTQSCILDEMLKKGVIDQQQYYAVCKDLGLGNAVQHDEKLILGGRKLERNYKSKKCTVCGNTWNVCKQKHNGRYICPHCVERRRNEEKKKV